MEEGKQLKAPVEADQLVKDTAGDYLTSGDDPSDVAEWEKEYRASPEFGNLIKAFQLSDTFFVDFCVPRALGYVFKKVAKSRYEGEKRQFNLEFSENKLIPTYKDFTHLGNFALRTNNLTFILKEILGAQNVRIVSKTGAKTTVALAPTVGGVVTTSFTTASQLLQEFQNHFPGQGRFAIAAVFGDLCKQGAHVSQDSPAGTAPAGRLAFNHWVVINGFSRSGGIAGCANSHADLEIWTWAQDYSIQVCEGHLLSYIQDVIFGEFA